MIDGPEDPDTGLMRRLREGNDAALTELMQRWQEPLMAFLYRYTQNESDAVDLAQETFVRVYEHRSRYDSSGKFSTWLYAIALNLARNHSRWKKRHPADSIHTGMNGAQSLEAQLTAAGRSPSEEADAAELAKAIRIAVAGLPEDQRAATLLFEFEGLSCAEIARALSCSVKAVERKLAHARQTLRAKLKRWVEKKPGG